MSFEQNPLEQLKLRNQNRGSAARPVFPQPDFERNVLRPILQQHRDHLLFSHVLVLRAHTLMLAEQRLIKANEAALILAALRSIEDGGSDTITFSSTAEDVSRVIDQLVTERAGRHAAGSMRLARSTNDLNATLTHIWMRDSTLDIVATVLALRAQVTELAWQHLTTLMAGYSHAQVAQPTTLAHYLSAVLAGLQRDTARLRSLYERTNRSPLGAGAFAESAINVRREQSASLLGFDGLIENSLDAVAPVDHYQEFVATLRISGAGLSRFVHDLLHWVRTEVGAIQVGEDFLQTSLLMPQKENPVVLEFIRARLAELHGADATVSTLVRSTPIGVTADFETAVRGPLFRAAADYQVTVRLLTAVLTTIRVHRPLLANRAGRYFSTTTDLVDLLAIDFEIPYLDAFAIVQRVIQTAAERGLDTMDLTPEFVDAAALQVIGQELGIELEMLHRCLAPRRFVERRSGLGGPAPSAVRAYLERERLANGREAGWIEETRGRIRQALARLEERARAMEAKGDTQPS